MQVPEKVVTVHKKLNETVKQCKKTCFIWDSNIFSSFIKEIRYFAGLNLISADDVKELKNELLSLLHEFEQMSVKGEFSNGNKVAIYLSNINFEATYTYIEKEISKSVYLEYIQSTQWTRKIHKYVLCKKTGYNR